MKIVRAEEMATIDRLATERYGISSLKLMENAGIVVAKRTKEFFRKKNVVVIAGHGNNGGDGLVAARYLKKNGFNIKIYITASEEELSSDCRTQLKKIKKLKIPCKFTKDIKEADLKDAILIDAIFGTGLKRNITGGLSNLIDCINSSGNPVVSVDIPSGISSDDGSIMGNAVRATITVTFGLPKRGHILYPGAEYTGRLFIEDIGFPQELLNSESIRCEIPEENFIKSLTPERKRYSHKGTYGHILVVAGSKGKTGAALLCARAALRAGAGLVTLGVPETLMPVFQSVVKDEMCLSLPDRGDGTMRIDSLKDIISFSERANVIAIGPGIGVTEDTKEIIKGIINNVSIPIVIDADGINCIEGTPQILKNAKTTVVLTPHPGEFSRLTGLLKEEIEQKRIDLSQEFSKNTGIITVLKGVPTVISHKDYTYINLTGNPGMAKAGSGDVLTGIIAGLLAQGLKGLEASIFGVYLHGLAGNIGSDQKGLHGLLASDIVEYIPEAFKRIFKEKSNK